VTRGSDLHSCHAHYLPQPSSASRKSPSASQPPPRLHSLGPSPDLFPQRKQNGVLQGQESMCTQASSLTV